MTTIKIVAETCWAIGASLFATGIGTLSAAWQSTQAKLNTKFKTNFVENNHQQQLC